MHALPWRKRRASSLFEMEQPFDVWSHILRGQIDLTQHHFTLYSVGAVIDRIGALSDLSCPKMVHDSFRVGRYPGSSGLR